MKMLHLNINLWMINMFDLKNAGASVVASKSKQRKELELALLTTVEQYASHGLDISYIAIDLKDGVDVRVTLNEVVDQTNAQTSKSLNLSANPRR